MLQFYVGMLHSVDSPRDGSCDDLCKTALALSRLSQCTIILYMADENNRSEPLPFENRRSDIPNMQ